MARRQRQFSLPDSLLLVVLSGAALLIVWLLDSRGVIGGWQLPVFYLVPYALGSADIVEHAVRAARRGRFDIDALMLLAALGAAILGDYVEGGLLLFLFGLGHALESRAMHRARHAITGLKDLAPDTANLVTGDEVRTVPVAQLAPGDTLLVRAGERLPADGTVTQGTSAVNQAPVTGESMPVLKEPGSEVFAGTINGEGALTVVMTQPPENSTIARVVRIVEEARVNKAPSQRFAERFTGWFAPAALLVSALTILIPWLAGMEFAESARRGLTVLVVMSPCALGLSAPSAILSGLGRAARGGVLVKGGLALEAAATVDTVIFDKTGTLTQGRPEVFHVEAVNGDSQGLLELTAAVETPSAHPLAQAIVRAAGPASLAGIEAFESVTGLGVTGRVDGVETVAGGPRLLRQAGVDVPEAVIARRRELQESGSTVVLVAAGGSYRGMIALRDALRPAAPMVVRQLRDLGISRMLLLTGDNAAAGQAVGLATGLDDVKSDVLPQDKADEVRRLEAGGAKVAMVGDGVNDAPAMATATLGVAMGGAGTDLALETADMVLMSDDISRLPFAFGLARATRRTVLTNIGISLGSVALLAPVAMAGGLNMAGAVILHEGSTIIVILNALRLLAFDRSGRSDVVERTGDGGLDSGYQGDQK